MGKDGVGLGDCAIAESKFEKGENISGRMLALIPSMGEIRQKGTRDMEFAINGLLARRSSHAQIGVISAPICAFYHRSLGGASIVSVQPCPLFSKLYPRKWTRDFDPWPRSADTHLTHRVRSAAPVL